MFAYNPQTQDRSGEIRAAGTMAAANSIGSALTSIANSYKKASDKKIELRGMDTAIGAMSDLGVITSDFRDKYMASDSEVRPFIFQSLVSPMFQSYQKKQGYKDYAEAMQGLYSNRGGGMPSPEFFEY